MAEDAPTTSGAPAQRSSWRALLGRVTFTEMAAAAVVAGGVTYILGWLVMLIRLSKADIPRLEALAVIPREVVLLVALQGLIVPGLLSLSILVPAILSGHWKREADQERGTWERNRAAVGKWAPWIIGALLGLFLSLLPWGWLTAFGLGYVLAVLWVARHFSYIPLRGWFALAVIYAFLGALASEVDASIKLREATVVESRGRATNGLLVASTDRAVYLGQPKRLIEMRLDPPARLIVGNRPPDMRGDRFSLPKRAIDLLSDATR